MVKNTYVLMTAVLILAVSFLVNSEVISMPVGRFGDVKDPPPVEYHRECAGQMCVLIQGPGIDQCSASADCRGPGGKSQKTHTECVGMMCKVVAGVGQNACSSDNDCRHLACENMACVFKEGKSQNQCGVDDDCYYTTCENMACVKKPGIFADQCSADAQCSHSICQTGMCVQVGGPGVSECTSSSDCIAEKIHLAYTAYYAKIKHAEYVGSGGNCGDGEWSCEVVEEFGDYPSIALDSNNNPHMSFMVLLGSTYKLMYAKFVGSGGNCLNARWDCSIVEVIIGSVQPTLVLDSNNLPHIAYAPAGEGILKYASYNGVNWVIEKVDLHYSNHENSFALDFRDNPHIAYQGPGLSLRYASKSGSGKCSTGTDPGWRCEVIENQVVAVGSIAVDKNDKPSISYITNLQGPDVVLKTAEKSAGNCGNGMWTCSIVDSIPGGKVGYSSSIDFDSTNKAHISYHDYTNSDLKLAKKVGSGGNCGAGQWNCYVVDSQGSVGSRTSIDIGKNDDVHITYVDFTDPFNKDLKYANFDGTSWKIQVVSPEGDSVSDTSIAVSE